jgi:uncharacterized delta-60 repeat protein
MKTKIIKSILPVTAATTIIGLVAFLFLPRSQVDHAPRSAPASVGKTSISTAPIAPPAGHPAPASTTGKSAKPQIAAEPSVIQKSAFRQLQTLRANKNSGGRPEAGARDSAKAKLRDEARQSGMEPWRLQPHDASLEFAFRPEPAVGNERAFAADNTRQQLTASYGKDGLRVRPMTTSGGVAPQATPPPQLPGTADWELNLRLTGIGYGQGAVLSDNEMVMPVGNRVESRRDSVTEWYVNDEQGIEHGFTVQTPPANRPSSPAEFRVELALKTGLQPRLDESGRAVHFHGPAGDRLLSYGGLLAYDATGRDLSARFELDGGRLAMFVDDRNAIYPIVIDPVLTVEILKDLNTVPNSANPNSLVEFQGLLYFQANDGNSRLWKSDGTEAGTILVSDSVYSPNYLTVMNGALYFCGYTYINGNWTGWELFKSDGTAAGTAVVTDIWPNGSSSPQNLTAAGNTLYFWANDGVNGQELWKSDGTAAGTTLVKDLNPGAGSSSFYSGKLAVGSTLFFAFQDAAGVELWRSDGTEAGTFRVKDINPGASSSYPYSLTEFQGKLYFGANDGVNGYRLWKSDGTEAGTVIVSGNISNPQPLTVMNGSLYFTASGNANGSYVGAELWKSDGTAAGTALVKDIWTGGNGSNPDWLTVVGNTLYFRASDGVNGQELWKSDGTAAGTTLVKDIWTGGSSSSPQSLTPVGNILFFWANDGVNGQELWNSDGTAAGTALVKDLTPGSGSSSIYSAFVAVGSTLFFGFQDAAGVELWRSDGTYTGTHKVKEIFPGNGSSSPYQFVEFNGLIYFSAYDPSSGTRLWRSDGTAVGTVFVSDSVYYPSYLTVMNGVLYFIGSSSATGQELWKSDGTAAGTTLVKDIWPGGSSSYPVYLTAAGNTLYFWANDGVNGQELWKSDGTAAGTTLVKDLNPGSGSSTFYNGRCAVGSTLFFGFQDAGGIELWRSDGTDAGTYRVKDILPGASSSSPNWFTEFNGSLYFTANDGVNGYRLWKSDGTEVGTVRVGNNSQSPSYLAVMNGALYFQATDYANPNSVGFELWKSDGTAAGTTLLKDIYPGSGSSYPYMFSTPGNRLFFWANDGVHGHELWLTDGTEAGTRLVKDINPGTSSGYGSFLTIITAGQNVYFQARDAQTGSELWTSDGTEAGTVRVADLNPGAGDGVYGNISYAGGNLFFQGYDPQTGYELWHVLRQNAKPVAAADSYSLNEDGTLTIAASAGVLDNDTDSDGGRTTDQDQDGVPDYLDAAPTNPGVNANIGHNGLVAELVPNSGPFHGVLEFQKDGSFTYAPVPNYAGTDTFLYRAGDGIESSDPATVTIAVQPVNDPPLANGQSLATAEDTSLTVLLSGSDVDQDSLNFVVATGPAHGTLSGTVPNLTYTPAANYSGPDSFTFKANDGTLNSALAIVAIIVTPVNDPPVAVADYFTILEDTSLRVDDVLINDTDADGDTLTVAEVRVPSHGNFGDLGGGVFGYFPAQNYSGQDSFRYIVSDGHGGTATNTAYITVSPVNDAPVANSQSVSTPEDSSIAITLSGSDLDVDALSYIVVSVPSHGTLGGTASNVTYTPAANYHGPDNFTFKVNDGTVDSAVATVSITVTAVNDGDPGDVETGFAANADGPIFSTTPQPDGRLIVSGGFTTLGGFARNNIARLNADGTMDGAFNPNANGQINSVAVQPDGRIVVGGGFATVGGVAHNCLARLNADGTVDATFNPDVSHLVLATSLQPDGKIIIGGYFTTVNGSARNYIARLNADGTLDTGFNPNANGFVYGSALLSDGRIVIGGNFTSMGGVARNYSARLNADGTLDSGFNPSADGSIRSTVLQPDGKLVIGGNFYTVGGSPRSFIARLNFNGTLDTGFNPNSDAVVHSIALQADGKIVLGGAFSTVGGQVRNRLARVNPDGTLDAAFNPDVGGANPSVFSTAVQADGEVVVGGIFGTVGGVSRGNLARLANDAATQVLTVPSYDRVQWLRGGAAPEAQTVTFEASNDGGATWTALSAGTRISGGWEKTGLSLSGSGQVRARARLTGSYYNGSSGLAEATTGFSFNTAPIVAHPIPDQSATYGAAFSFTVPASTFSDADAGQTLAYTASGLPAWLSFDANTRTFSGTPPALGSSTVTVTATDSGSPALSVSTSYGLVVGKATLTATGDRLYRFYGEANPPLTGTLTGVVNGDNITASYSTTAEPTSPPAAYTVAVTLHDPDNRLGNYEVTNSNGLLYVQPALQTIAFGTIPPHVYGDAPLTVPVSASSGLPVTLTSSVASVATVSGNTLTITGAGTTLLTAYQNGDANYQPAALVQTSYAVGKATPVITWPIPATITSSTTLSAAQLNAAANIPGSFSYSPAAGTRLARGTHVLSTTFTPDVPANYTTASATVSLTVLNSAPVATAQSLTTAEDTALAITLAGTDADADALIFSVVSNPTHGTLSGTPPNLTYTPWPNFNSTDQFTFQANDGSATSTATIGLTVTPVNDAPVANALNLTTAEDTALPVTLSAADIEAGGYKVLQVFGSTTGAGRSPSGGLIEGADQMLYGTTEFGGAGGNGTVFRVNRDGSGYTALQNFAGNNLQGKYPRGRLVAGPGGVLYGTTASGGNSNGGTVWKLNADGTGFAVLQHLTSFPGSSTGLLLGSDGALYGTTVFGGASGNGTVFKLGTDGSGFAVLHSFSGLVNEGGRPYAQLVEDAAGALYGTTEVGGADANNGGTVFRLQKNGTGFTVLQAFAGGTGNGGTLRRGLLLASDGALYGVTPTGGQNSKGTVFRIQRDGTGFRLLVQFAANGTQGGIPQATLVEDADGVLYGGNTAFGALGGGTVFRLNKDGTAFGVMHHFRSGTADGNQMQGELVVGSDNWLYGTTFNGTATGSGELFKLARSATGLNYTLVSNPGHGSLSGTAPNLTYTPALNYNGPDSFTFKVNDGTVDSTTETVSITVAPVNDAPLVAITIPDQAGQYGSPFAFIFAANPFTDVDVGQTLSYTASGLPAWLSFDVNTRTLSGTPGVAGTFPIIVTAADNASPALSASATFTLNVSQAPQTISFGSLPNHTYGDAPFTINATTSLGLPVSFTSLTPSVATASGNTVTIVGAGTATIRASQAGDANYLPAADVNQTFTVAKATPVITWANPADINCHTALGSAQLNAKVNVAGTFSYNPPAGTTLALGSGQVLSVNFTPANSVNYNPASATTTVNVRLDAGVSEVWEQRSFPVDYVALDNSGNAVLAGSSWGGSSMDYHFAKYAGASGALVWDKRYNGPASNYDEANGVAVDASGNVVVTGRSYNSSGNADYYTAKYAATDGALLWEQRYNGPANGDDNATALALDNAGNVIVTGYSHNGSNDDYYTAKYAAANGTLLWEKRYNGPANGYDYANAVAVDGNGNVIVTGSSTSQSGYSDYYTAKYSVADGALLWERRYNGPGNFDDQARAVAVDNGGNVIVTGFSVNMSSPNFKSESYTVKYATADGALIWEQRSDGPTHNSNYGQDVKVDSSGNVIVAGNSSNGSTHDYYTVKYASGDGAVVWEHRVENRLAFLEASPRLAVDASGNVILAGVFKNLDSTYENYTASYASATGASIWEQCSPASSNMPRSVALDANGNIVAAGYPSVFYHQGTHPAVTLNGPAAMSIVASGTFTDPGATAVDACGSSLPVTVAGTVNVLAAGTYTLTYSATDAVGQTASATRTVTVTVSDHPPVAAAGPDQTLYAGANCAATLQLDGSASSDADGDALTYSWVIYTQTPSGPVASAPVLGALITWTILAGTYEAELTVSTTVNGQTLTAKDRAVITVVPSAPVLTTIDPPAAHTGSAGLTLTVSGGCFQPGATVYWNGSPRPTTVDSSAQLKAAISASDLNPTEPITTALVTVTNGDGQVSNPLGFSIVAQSVGTVATSVAPPGGTVTVVTTPTSVGDAGVAVRVQNIGGDALVVVAASYASLPVGETAFKADTGAFVDVQITGADDQDVATVDFSFLVPSTMPGWNEIKLTYYDSLSAAWITVLDSSGQPPVSTITDNGSGTTRLLFTVAFNANSTPQITALTGTVFGMFNTQPQIKNVTGPTGPVALGGAVTISVPHAVVGNPLAAWVTFVWDDGTENTFHPTAAGQAAATKVYSAPGVYGLVLRVTDEQGNSTETRFEYVVIYDPNGGFVTGGGWINSPAGAYVADPTLIGKANFGFVSKYQKGKTVPTGETEFQFQVANFKFSSTVYEWLVVSGPLAQYKGSGTVNGAGDYGFILTATDGQIAGGGGVDKFRIKIWNKATGAVVYDSVLGASDDINSANPRAIGGGSIVIQKAK